MSNYEPPPPAADDNGGDERYSASTAWSYGWDKFVANLGPILLAVLVLLGVQLALSLVGGLASRGAACDPGLNRSGADFAPNSCGGFFSWQTFVLLFFLLLDWIVSLVIATGIVRGALDIVEGRTIDYRRMLSPALLVDVLVTALIVGGLTFVGLVLFVVPGLLVMFFTSFALLFLVDRADMSPVDAITASFELVKDNPGPVLTWFLLGVVTWIVGLCLCGIGLLAAVPVILIGTAYTYKKLTGQPVAP